MLLTHASHLATFSLPTLHYAPDRDTETRLSAISLAQHKLLIHRGRERGGEGVEMCVCQL